MFLIIHMYLFKWQFYAKQNTTELSSWRLKVQQWQIGITRIQTYQLVVQSHNPEPPLLLFCFINIIENINVYNNVGM